MIQAAIETGEFELYLDKRGCTITWLVFVTTGTRWWICATQEMVPVLLRMGANKN